MEQIKTYIYFFYYSIYKFWSFISGGNDFAHFQTQVTIQTLLLWFLLSLINIIETNFGVNITKQLDTTSDILYFLVPFGIVPLLILHLYFGNKNNWALYYNNFENYSLKNKIVLHSFSWLIILSFLYWFWSNI